MKKRDERMHSMLDGEIPVGKSSASMESDPEKLSVYRERLRLLEEFEGNAPDDFVGRVMAGLPDSADRKWYDRKWALWPGRGLWAVPTFVGAVGMMLIIFGIGLLYGGGAEDLVAVHFDVYAPSAKKVEMVGTFSGWMPGKIALKGPDSIGYWGCSVKLHPGRYEYLFLIDGAKLVPDGGTAARCPDGFGSQNSLVLVKDEGSFWRRHFQSATAGGCTNTGCFQQRSRSLPAQRAKNTLGGHSRSRYRRRPRKDQAGKNPCKAGGIKDQPGKGRDNFWASFCPYTGGGACKTGLVGNRGGHSEGCSFWSSGPFGS